MADTCDLHAHTTASDGDLTPTELVQLAAEIGLGALAVTDHDTVAGIPEALRAAAEVGIPFAPGVEISAEFEPGTMHILGYFVDHTNVRLLEVLEELRGGRDVRNRKIIRRLNELGLEVTIEEWEAEAGEESVGRPQLAKILAEKGYVTDLQEAFDKYLAKGAPAYVDRLRLGPEEAIILIREAGGLTVLAHPPQLEIDDDELESLVARLTRTGLAGIECYYSDHTPEQTAYFLKLAEKYNLLVTGGSDFHGSSKPHIRLGCGAGNLRVPQELFERLLEASESLR